MFHLLRKKSIVYTFYKAFRGISNEILLLWISLKFSSAFPSSALCIWRISKRSLHMRRRFQCWWTLPSHEDETQGVLLPSSSHSHHREQQSRAHLYTVVSFHIYFIRSFQPSIALHVHCRESLAMSSTHRTAAKLWSNKPASWILYKNGLILKARAFQLWIWKQQLVLTSTKIMSIR